jgi:predicted MFS family arabinose efflux permease
VFIAQPRFFPNRFIPKIVAGLSIVWMMSAFCGPVIGGAFATWGVWRYAYWAFALQAILLVVSIRYLLTADQVTGYETAERIPFVRIFFLSAAILLVSMAGVRFDQALSPLLLLLGCLSLMFFVHRDRIARSGRLLPLQAIDLSHPLGNGIATTFTLCLCLMSFLVYGSFILIHVYQLTPFSAGLVVLTETLAWGSAAVIFSTVSPQREGVLIRIGSAIVVVGLIGMAIVFPSGPLWLVVILVILSNGGFGMMWGFIIRRINDAAPESEKDRAASLIPITQQLGFALGAAFSGLIANSLGLSEQMDDEGMRRVSFWLFAGFVPIALIGTRPE